MNVLLNSLKQYKIKTLTSSGPVAQRLEQRTHNPLVPGSNPGGPTIFISFAMILRIVPRLDIPVHAAGKTRANCGLFDA
jgi:hypothetical protein